MDGLARSRRTKTALALITATAALSGGTQALAPTPVLAMDNQGNECQNLPTWERTVCEMENGGGSGVPGGTAGGSNNTTSGEEETIGEVIRIHDTPPSECMLRPRTCLPSTPGGRHQIGSDGVRPRGPRPGHRPVRVGEVEKGTWTEERCRKFISGGALAPAQKAEQDAEEKEQGLLTWQFALASQDFAAERAERSVKRELLEVHALDLTVDLEMRLTALARARRLLKLRFELNDEKVRRARAELRRAHAEAEAEDKALRQMCKQRYGVS